ncbi:hypothetical protein EMIT0180MI3_360012 [Priestia megaterium]
MPSKHGPGDAGIERGATDGPSINALVIQQLGVRNATGIRVDVQIRRA